MTQKDNIQLRRSGTFAAPLLILAVPLIALLWTTYLSYYDFAHYETNTVRHLQLCSGKAANSCTQLQEGGWTLGNLTPSERGKYSDSAVLLTKRFRSNNFRVIVRGEKVVFVSTD
jgi:hypothetical protein